MICFLLITDRDLKKLKTSTLHEKKKKNTEMKPNLQ